MVKVLIVDDSAFMRNALANMLAADPEITVVGTARDGVEAVDLTAVLRPDVVTLDVEMPRMDGIEALRRIMERTPVPVVMVSSLTTEGAKETLEALDLGAVDFIPKNLSDLSIDIVKIKEFLIERVKGIAHAGVARRHRTARPLVEKPAAADFIRARSERKARVVSIGTSTGGPRALQDIIPHIPETFPVPIVVAQHMPPNFTGPFAERLNHVSRITVKEASDGETLRPGVAYIAPGRGHMRLKRTRSRETVITISEQMHDLVYRPSVDALMRSVAECYPGRALGMILTGMGNDGLMGLAEIKKSGGRIFAQDEASCVVYGMPRAAIEAGLADKVLPVDRIAGEIINAV
jgi:two-component system chemotaxis response regulator CheB